ncbi:MAG: ABC transporter permease [Methanomassiliicoccales archaeon]|nr:ABC transporter permease [Methanomassiliicoccales archaeon]NYT15616.1 ABC transporter permease [Methanomassiliicoccales archaeon]
MTRYLYRKQNRELRRIKFRAIGAGLLIFFAVALYIGMGSMIPSAQSTLEQVVEDQHLSDLVVRVELAPESELAQLEAIDGVEEAEARLDFASRIMVRGEQVAATLLGIDPSSPPDINILEIPQGSGTYFSQDWNDTVILEKGYADNAGIGVGDSISLMTSSGWDEKIVVGLAYSPEFIFMPINPQSIMPIPGSMAVVYLPEPSLRQSFGVPAAMVNEFLFLLEDGKEMAAKQSITEELADDTVIYTQTQDELYGYALIKEDLKQGEMFAGVIAGLILIVAFFVVYSSFTRMVQEQRREIGITRALGYRRGQVLMSYVYLALIVGGFSSLAGVLLGIPVGQMLGDYYAQLAIHASSAVFILPLEMVLTGAVFGPITAILASTIAVWSTVRMEPHEAIKGTRNRMRKRRKETKVSPPRKMNYMLKYAWRKMIRQKGRTAIMVVAVAFSVVMGSMSFLMIASFENSIAATIDNDDWDLIVDYAAPIDRENASSITSPYIVDEVMVSKVSSLWESDGSNGTALVIGMGWNQTLHRFSLDRGRLAERSNESMISYLLANDEGLSPGDSITLSTPIGTSHLIITGIVNDMIGSIYVNDSIIGEISGVELFSGAYLKVQDGHIDEVEETFLGSQLVANIQEKGNIKSGMLDFFTNYEDVLYLFGLISVLIAAIAISNIVYVSVLERRAEYSQLRAIGYRRKEVAKSVYLEVVILIIIGALVAIPLLWLVMESMATEFRIFFPMYQTILYLGDWYGYGVIVVMTFVLGLLASVPAIRYITKLDVANTVTGGRFG